MVLSLAKKMNKDTLIASIKEEFREKQKNLSKYTFLAFDKILYSSTEVEKIFDWLDTQIDKIYAAGQKDGREDRGKQVSYYGLDF